jgi:flagellar basal body-associated protein FliL
MKTKRAAATLEIPQNTISEIFAMLHDFASDSQSKRQEISSKIKGFFAGSRNNKEGFKRFIPIVVLVVFVLIGLFFVGRFIKNSFSNQTLNAADSRVAIKGPKAQMTIGKTFEFPLTDDSGKTVATLKFFLDDAELRDEIILNGQKATLVKGRTYLILTIKLTNNSDKFIQMKVRNYVRLNVNGAKDEWTAAQVYNDPVEVQPESTQQTRLGFPVNDSDKDMILRVGDLEGKKELIPLNFNK